MTSDEERLVFGKLRKLNVLQERKNMINDFANYSIKYEHPNNDNVSC